MYEARGVIYSRSPVRISGELVHRYRSSVELARPVRRWREACRTPHNLRNALLVHCNQSFNSL